MSREPSATVSPTLQPRQASSTPSTSKITQKQPSPNPSPASKSSNVKQKAAAKSQPLRASRQPANPSKSSVKTVSVNVYKLDNQCKGFVSEKVAVPADQPITKAIVKVLSNTDNADFNLSGYRVNVASGVATIDLRVAPGSKRRFRSLSICEQRSLFGSLRKTLTSNARFKVKTVKFTDRGQAIAL